MEQAVLHTAAYQFIRKYGPAAESMLRERSDAAADRGHLVAAATWRELAEATAVISAGGPTGELTDCQERSPCARHRDSQVSQRIAPLVASRHPGALTDCP